MVEDDKRDFVAEVLGYTPEKGSKEKQVVEELLELHWRVRRMGQLRDLVLQVRIWAYDRVFFGMVNSCL